MEGPQSAENVEIDAFYQQLKAENLDLDALMKITADTNENPDKIEAAYKLIAEYETGGGSGYEDIETPMAA